MLDFKLSSINLPVKISLFIGIPSLALIFYYLKKTEKDFEDEFSYENAIRSRQSIIEVKVPSDCVRSIIGPQGAVIKEIQQKTNTRINLKEKNGRDNKPNNNGSTSSNNNNENELNTEKTLVIRGSNVNVQKAELEIKRLIVDMPTLITQHFYVPEYACGRIIGRGGANIREMSTISNCKIKINDKLSTSSSQTNLKDLSIPPDNQESSDFNRKIATITGNFEQIEHAKVLILERIKEEEMLREKRNNKNKPKKGNQNIYKQNSSHFSNSNNEICDPIENIKPILFGYPKLIDLESCLDDNKCVDVFITALADPFAFWVQIINENSAKLDQLTDEMNDFYSHKNNSEFKNINDLKVGSLVAVKYDKESWHRAEIKGFNPDKSSQNQLIDVYFIDFGNSAYVGLDDIDKLENKYYELPMQAIECTLDDVDRKTNEKYWSEESINYFEEITYFCRWKALKLKLVKFKQETYSNQLITKASVLLFDKSKDVSISELLISNGYAKSLNDSNEKTSMNDSNQEKSQLTQKF